MQAPATEDANPDYQGGSTQSGTTGTDYYDNSYSSYNSASPSGFGQPYSGPGVSSYNYTPSWSVSPSFYGSPYGYGTGLSLAYGYGGFGGYSPYSYGYGSPYGGFYDPFYSPWGYGYGSRFSIGFGYGGFGYPYGGYGGYGYPYGYGGYGGYGYPGYAYGGGGGYYGADGGYGGARRYVYKQGIMNGAYANGYDAGAIKVGRRESRYSNAAGSSGATMPSGGTISNRRASSGANSGFDRVMAPGGNVPTSSGLSNNGQPAMDRSRRFDQNTMNSNSPGAAAGGFDQQRAANMANPAAAQAQPQRGGFFHEMFSAPANGGQGQGQNGGYSQPQRGFDQSRSYSQPSQPQRSYSQPQRSYSQPAQAPSYGGGGGGGGSFGGGGGGGGGGRRGR